MLPEISWYEFSSTAAGSSNICTFRHLSVQQKLPAVQFDREKTRVAQTKFNWANTIGVGKYSDSETSIVLSALLVYSSMLSAHLQCEQSD